ncbi:CFI-box-CTERM domain-containing protein [Succiniclasticum sp.]|uniref:CFI-box-CTERM domain-containing protein n=1 Tax=Succiniclasticum sp. TaxID=2775030 RepID=UPI0034DB2C93
MYVFTATYQDAMHPDVVLLRDFRDKFLRKSVFGRIFIAFYYKVGPYLAYLPDHYLWIRNLSKKVLALIVAGIKNRFYK